MCRNADSPSINRSTATVTTAKAPNTAHKMSPPTYARSNVRPKRNSMLHNTSDNSVQRMEATYILIYNGSNLIVIINITYCEMIHIKRRQFSLKFSNAYSRDAILWYKHVIRFPKINNFNNKVRTGNLIFGQNVPHQIHIKWTSKKNHNSGVLFTCTSTSQIQNVFLLEFAWVVYRILLMIIFYSRNYQFYWCSRNKQWILDV